MTPRPHDLSLDDNGDLLITWSDGTCRRYRVRQLRDHCPCATCRERRSAGDAPAPGQLPVLSQAETRPLKITAMNPVGSYAYGIAFSDGHDSGIFTLELLYSLGTQRE